MKNDRSFEAQMAELEARIAWFHSDAFRLEEAADKFKELSALAETIEAQLSSMKQEVEILKKKFDE